MVQNAGDIIPEDIEATGQPDRLNDVSNLVGQGAQRVALIASLGLATLASETRADEYRVADAGPTVEGTVARVFDGLPTTVEEITAQAEIQRVISDVISSRQNGLEFYGPYLAEFDALSQESQYQVAQLIIPGNGEGGPEYPQDTIDLIQDLRMPQSMIDAILAEALANGADDFFEIPGFKETLNEFRINGEVGARSIGFIFEKAPVNSSKIFFVLVSQASIDANRDAQGRLVDVQGRLVDVQGRLVDVQGRLVDAQGRLVDSEEQLLLAEELEDKANEVGETADELRD